MKVHNSYLAQWAQTIATYLAQWAQTIATKFQSFTHQRCLFHRFAVFYLTSGS